MSTRTGSSFYETTWNEFLDMVRDFVEDTTDWLSGLSDVERLMGLSDKIIRFYTVKVDDDVDPEARPSEVTEELLEAASDPGPDPEELARMAAEAEAARLAAEAEAMAARGDDDDDDDDDDDEEDEA